MKIIAIGDIHGRVIWKDIISKKRLDKVVFIGDYFDSFDVPPEDQILNFKEIVEYKIKFPNKVVLLFGNHDYHYLKTTKENYSGFNSKYALTNSHLLHSAIDAGLMQMCFQYGNFLFTHAGVTETWAKANAISDHFEDLPNTAARINNLFIAKPEIFKFTPGRYFSNTGDDITQTPIWVRPNSLCQDSFAGFFQIVGHTQHRKLEISYLNKVAFIDTLGASKEFLIIQNEMLTIGHA